jgi:hypothetical protein
LTVSEPGALKTGKFLYERAVGLAGINNRGEMIGKFDLNQLCSFTQKLPARLIKKVRPDEGDGPVKLSLREGA